MAVVTVKSAAITNRDATPVVLTASSQNYKRSAKGVVALTSGDSIASKYLMCEVPSNAIISAVKVSCGAITTCAGDIGLYRTTRDGGAVVDVDLFASAQSLATALADSNVMFESTNITIATSMSRVWQLLALTSDPCLQYDVCLTLTAAAGSAGTASVEVEYTQ